MLINYCSDHGKVRPSTEDLPGCMPSNEYLAGLKWTSWRSVAYGSGVFRVNNCTPTCAQGKYVSYPILTVLWRAEPWPGHAGRDYFSRVTVIFTGAHHPHGPPPQTLTLPALHAASCTAYRNGKDTGISLVTAATGPWRRYPRAGEIFVAR